jgi:superfamily II DNA or RNA helicase
MEQHIARYTKYIHEDLSALDVETATYKEHLHKSFEWFACMRLSIQYDSIFLRWEDVPPQLREEKGMSRDMGIDAWDIEGNRVSQMKLYQGCISWRHFATFLSCCDVFENPLKILYRTEQSTVCDMIQFRITKMMITDITVSDSTFRSECKRIQSLTFPSSKQVESFVIRPYQAESIAYLEKGRDIGQNVYLCIPTGCGKTVILLHYHLHYRIETLLVLVPRVVLMEQWGEECDTLGIKPYLIGTGQHRNMDQYTDETIVICVYDSFPNIYDQRDRFKRVCIDEAHHVKIPERYMETEAEHDTYDSEDQEDEEDEEYEEDEEDEDEDEEHQGSEEDTVISYMKCIQSLSDTKRVIYLSATLDSPTDDSLFFEYKVRQAIDEGYLCDYQFVFPIFEQEYVTNEHLAQYLIHKQHESHCVIYAPSCKEGKEFTDMLNQLRKGCAGYMDADTSYKERQRLFAEFESGAIHFLVNIRILVEGFNAPHIRSIFFLQVSTSEIFIIQAIGRALRPHCDKRLATIYVPFTQESDAERIQTFLHQLSTYDERIKKTISEKKMGGYMSLEHGEDVDEEDEDEDDTMDLFTFRYNLIVDRMGKSDQLEEMAIKRALEYKAFYEEFDRKASEVLSHKKKDHGTKEQKYEHALAVWFSCMKQVVKSTHKLYPSVEKILIGLLGERWYLNDNLEENAMKQAIEYKTFYQEKQRKPSSILQKNTKEQKENATYEQKHEHKLSVWFGCMKKGKKGNYSNKLYPSVEEVFIGLLGERWYINDKIEENATKRALDYKTFYQEKQRKPSCVLQNKTKEHATYEQKHEHKLSQWFNNTKNVKKDVTKTPLYSSVEEIMVHLLGNTWYLNDNLEENAMKKALEYKTFYQEKQRKPSCVLQKNTKEQKENATYEQKHEHRLATWFRCIKSAKQGTSKGVVYPSVEKLLIDIFGSDWFR